MRFRVLLTKPTLVRTRRQIKEERIKCKLRFRFRFSFVGDEAETRHTLETLR